MKENNINTEIEITCPFCGAVTYIGVNDEDLKKWQDGMLIQRAMPYFSPEQRELLITGMCYDCQAGFFKN